MQGLRLGFAITGSFCTFDRILQEIRILANEGAEITPILSYNTASMDTRFGTASQFRSQLLEITGRQPLETLTDVEPIGPQGLFDVIAVCPCTGSSLARLACGLSDTPVTLAVKSHLRNGRPVVLGVSTNDALGLSMRNLALLKNVRNIYFVPLEQDNPEGKPNSMVADFSLMKNTILSALKGVQIQPVFL